MPNPDVFFGILQGYGEASRAQEQKAYEEESKRRQNIAQFWLEQSRRQDIRPEARDVATQNYLGIVQTPMHKKLGKNLESVQDFLKVPVQPPMGSPMWQGGQTTRGVAAENMPVPSALPPGAAPQPAQTGPLPGGIAPPPVAPPSMAAAPATATTTPPPSTFQASVPSPPPGYTVRAPAAYTPEEQAHMIEHGEAAKITGQYSAKIQASDVIAKRLMDSGIPEKDARQQADEMLGIRLPKPPAPPKEPTPRLGKPVQGKVDGQPTQATWNNIAGKWIDTDTGQEITGFVPDLSIKNKQYRDRYDDKNNHIYREYFSGDDPSKVVHTADLGISLRAMGQTVRQEQMLQYKDPETGQWLIGVIDKATRQIRPATLQESGQSAVGTGPATSSAAQPPTPPQKAEPKKVSGTAAKLTGTAANRAVAGTSIEKIAPELIANIQKNRAKLGPLKGRVRNFMLDKGIRDPELRDLQSALTSMAPLLATLHGGRATEYMIRDFQNASARLAEDPDNAIRALQAQMRVASQIRGAQEETLGTGSRKFSVQFGGQIHTFPSQKALDGFKQEMGIR